MHRLAILSSALLLFACVPPPAGYPPPAAPQPAAPVSAAGTWATTWTWGSGTCGLIGSTNSSLGVSQTGAGYMIQENTPGTSVNGSIQCGYDDCKMLVSESSMLNGGPANVSVNFTLAPNGAISGSGSVSLTSPSCSQTFIANGRRV